MGERVRRCCCASSGLAHPCPAPSRARGPKQPRHACAAPVAPPCPPHSVARCSGCRARLPIRYVSRQGPVTFMALVLATVEAIAAWQAGWQDEMLRTSAPICAQAWPGCARVYSCCEHARHVLLKQPARAGGSALLA